LPKPVEHPTIDADIWDAALSLPQGLPAPSLVLSAERPTPYHVEIWCEKSTINDILGPLARQYGLNVVVGVGELSATRCREVVERAHANGGRPVRILYVSDFDPGGQSMPLAVARKIEWELRKAESGCDIRLQPIALTHQQCVEYALPRTPIKETERRGARFEQRFGEGATELDALEALHPGELRQIIVAEIERFLDPELEDRWSEFKEEAQAALNEIEAAELDAYADEREALQERLDALREQARALDRDLSSLNETIRRNMMVAAPSIFDDLDIPEAAPADEWDSPLFDSARGYVEQIDAYKAFQGKPTQRKKRGAAA
jgi:hypothetical protein